MEYYVHRTVACGLSNSFGRLSAVAGMWQQANAMCVVISLLGLHCRNEERMIALVQPIHDANAMSGCRLIPSHCWLNDDTLAIGWANSVCICVILPTANDQASVGSFLKRFHHYLRWSGLWRFSLHEEHCYGDGRRAADSLAASSFLRSDFTVNGVIVETFMTSLFTPTSHWRCATFNSRFCAQFNKQVVGVLLWVIYRTQNRERHDDITDIPISS